MIPSYNYGRYLRDCVASAATQQGVEVDVVLVDNGSTDGSPQVAAALVAEYPQVRVVTYADNDGIIASFNRCRDEVRGEYAMLLCADDCLTPGSLARSVQFMNAHPSVGLVYGTALDFADLAEVNIGSLPTTVQGSVVHRGTEWIDRLCRTASNPIRTPEILMRTSVLDAAGRYDPACPYTSDLNMWLRLAAQADVAYLRGPIQALFRRHDGNEGRAYPHASVAELRQRWAAFDQFLEGVDDSPRRVEWERSIRGRMGADCRYAASRAFARGDHEVDDLLALGADIDKRAMPTVERGEWAIRRALGPKLSRLVPLLAVRPVVRRLERTIANRRRMRRGLA
jgi:glycosyltransferase involved in cell wall biosynthesis